MTLKVDQTLHGYAHGHSLLQSSTRLSIESERLMLALSDMSGPGMRPGFESYITAYPLPVDQIYVFARTWYAPEMQRPGCVWTHSLLIHDKERMPDPQVLTGLFRRPTLPITSDSYAVRLVVDDLDRIEPDHRRLERDIVRELLLSLYGQPDKPVYLLAKGASDFESLVLDIWDQQWPQLRRTFSFCTGSIANRTIRAKPLDLQVVPQEASPELRREFQKGCVVNKIGRPGFEVEIGDWVYEAQKDLTSSTSFIRPIAWALADTQIAERRSFPAVFYLASIVEKQNSLSGSAEKYVRAVADASTEVDVPISLIKTVLVPRMLLGTIDISDIELIRALSIVTPLGAITVEDLEISDRICRLWESNRVGVLKLFSELLHRDETTEVGNAVLIAIGKMLRPEDLDSVIQMKPGLLSVIIKQKPQLATSPVIWQRTQNSQAEIFHALMSSNLDHATLEAVAGAILESGSNILSEHASTYRQELIAPLLNWLNKNSFVALNRIKLCARYLQQHGGEVAWWIESNEPSVEVLLALTVVLPADLIQTQYLKLANWMPVLSRFCSLELQDAISSGAFLFALALQHCELEAVDILCEVFEIVHNAAAREDLGYERWKVIATLSPPLHYWKGWDKCERMRAAVLDKFIECGWPSRDLFRVVKTPAILRDLYSLSITTLARKKFLKHTAKNAITEGISADLRQILEPYVTKNK